MDDTRFTGAVGASGHAGQAESGRFEGSIRRRTPWNTMDGRVISLVSRKGGVGKTTSAVNLGAALALSGHTVLVIGTDPQCGVCRTLGPGPDALTADLSEIFSGQRVLTDLVQPSPLRDLFYVSPRIESLEDEEDYLRYFEQRVDDFVCQVDRARHLYDTILIDCPPSLGPATRAALLASDSYLVPVQAEELCRDSVASLLEFIESFCDRNILLAAAAGEDPYTSPVARLAQTPLVLEGLFLTMASDRTRMGRHVAERLGQEYGTAVLDAGIPRTTRLAEMALRGKPAVIYDRRSPGSRAYFDLADELVDRYCRAGESSAAADADADAAGDLVPLEDPLPLPKDARGGLDRFLAELGGAAVVSASIPAFEEPCAPEMVSLDDLLAEEEDANRDHDDWEDGGWPLRRGGRDRLN